jgi:ABC-type glycerol-3-phosphate transport system substrate-binding protein
MMKWPYKVWMKKVKPVARRKSALVFVLLCVMVLILSPWADAPSTSSIVVDVPEGDPLAIAEPIVTKEIAQLTVEAALDETDFAALSDHNDTFVRNHPDIEVELRRVDPSEAHSAFEEASLLEDSADILLMSNDWVKEFAASGYLIPADAAFVGKALAEQFDALAAPLKWNKYLWGVPYDMDPYVLVWNESLLQEWLGIDVTLPLSLEQWTALAAKSAETGGTPSWLALNPDDPLALMAWLDNASGERSDGLWVKDSQPWEGTSFEQSLSLLEVQRLGVQYTGNYSDVHQRLKEGTNLVAAVPYSIAYSWTNNQEDAVGPKLKIDHQSWKLPYVWPRGNSFAISSDTDAEEAAHAWISEMTAAPLQLENLDERNRLPVFRSLYDSIQTLSNLLPGRSGQNFPNQPSLAIGPELPGRMLELTGLWKSFASGEMTLAEWKTKWQQWSSTDFQLDD